MKANDLNHKFAVGDTVLYAARQISGDGSRQHHFLWEEGIVEALGWSKGSHKEIETGEIIESTNIHGLVMRRKVRETRFIKLPLYKINGRWTGKVKAA